MVFIVEEEIEREQKEELFRDYVGQALWHITTIQHFKAKQENSMPQYVELSHKELQAPKESAEQIKAHILEKLGC